MIMVRMAVEKKKIDLVRFAPVLFVWIYIRLYCIYSTVLPPPSTYLFKMQNNRINCN